MSRRLEFLIVGAGAAGCVLAWLLRRAGREVLVLELRDMQEKDKLCGGVLGREAVVELQTIFGADALAELALTYPPHLRNRCLDRETISRIGFATLPRKRLDDWLLARCLEEGAKVRDRMSLLSVDERTRVVSCANLRSRETVRIGYDTLVGADGATSAVRRVLLGQRQSVAVSFEGTVPCTGDDLVFVYHPLRMGYCWYIPVGEAANVGCMLHGGTPDECRAWLGEFCASLGLGVPALRGAPIPSGDDVCLCAAEHAWLVGDAAGLARPFDGGGIHLALGSARLLAEALLGGASYEEAMRPMLLGLTQAASHLERGYFLNALHIARAGHPWGV